MKKYIMAMSIPRSQALAKLEALSEELSNHIIKCVLYNDILPNYMNHWVEEVAGFLHAANRIHSKTALKPRDYVQSIFSEFGEDADDAYVNMKVFLTKYRSYPDVKVTEEMGIQLADAYKTIVKLALPILSSNKLFSINEWIGIVEPVLKCK